MVEGTGSSGAPQKGTTGTVALTDAQRTNPLTVVATAKEYPEALLSQGEFNSLRASFRKLAMKTPTEQMTRMETLFGKWGLRLHGLQLKVIGAATK